MNNTRIEQLITVLGDKLLQLYRVKKNILPALEIYTKVKQTIHTYGLKRNGPHWDFLLKDMMKLSTTLNLLLKQQYTGELKDVVDQIIAIVDERRKIKTSESCVSECILQKSVSTVEKDSKKEDFRNSAAATIVKENARKRDDLDAFTPDTARSNRVQCEEEKVKTKLLQVDTQQIEEKAECEKTVECLQSSTKKTLPISCQQERKQKVENTDCCKAVKCEETIGEKSLHVHTHHDGKHLKENTNCETVECGENIGIKSLLVRTGHDEKHLEENTNCDKTLKCPQVSTEESLQMFPQQDANQNSEYEKTEDCEDSDINIKLQLCQEQVEQFELEIKSSSNQKRKPIIVLIGETGAGKSSLGNLLLGKKVFRTSVGSEGCTAEVSAHEGRWQGSGEEIVVVDCPGLGDLQDRDDAYIDCMVDELKKLGYVTTFLLVVNGEQPRLSQARFDMMDVFRGVFSIKMFTNTLLVFTHWGYDTAAVTRREEQGCTNLGRTRDYNSRLQKRYKLSKPLPASFLDCVLSMEDKSQEKTLKELEGIKKLVCNMKPYDCVNIFKMKENIKELNCKLKEAEKLKDSLFCWANRTQRKEAGVNEEHEEDLQKVISNVTDSISCLTSKGSAVKCMSVTNDRDSKETEVKCLAGGYTTSFPSNGQSQETHCPVVQNCDDIEKGNGEHCSGETKSSFCAKSLKQKPVKGNKKGENCRSEETPKTGAKGKQFIKESIETQKLWTKLKGSAQGIIKVLNTTATILTQSRSPFLKGDFGFVMQILAVITKLILALTLL